MFGGLLITSGTTLCKPKAMPDNKFKKKFEQQYGRRTIRFHNVPERIAKEPFSVLQQENNDVVDAVRSEYQDLPQCQPVSELVGNIVGLHGETCAVNVCRPEVMEKGTSPIHSTRNENTSEYDIPSYRDRESDAIMENGAAENKKISITLHEINSAGEGNGNCRISSASSGIGTNSPDDFENDSLEEFPLSENGSQPLDEGAFSELNGNGFPSYVPKIDRGVYPGGRLSVLQLECAPSCLCVNACDFSTHGTKAGEIEASDDGTRITNERLTWGDIAQNINPDILRFDTPSADVTGPLNEKNMHDRGQSPLRREDLEKWLNDVEVSRKTRDEDYTHTLLGALDVETEERHKETVELVSGNRRIRAPLQESLQLLKRLELISEDDLQLTQTKSPVHRGGRASCLKTVQAPSSLCLCAGKCNAHFQTETTSGQLMAPTDSIGENTDVEGSSDMLESEYRYNPTITERIARGGRLSCLNQVHASSCLCIHGPSCKFHCQKTRNFDESTTKPRQKDGGREMRAQKSPELLLEEINSGVKELRGASSFGEVKDSTKKGITYCRSGQRDIRGEDSGEKNIRGASSFGYSTTQQPMGHYMRGASSFAPEIPNKLHTNRGYIKQVKQANDTHWDLDETRGASCFASLDESITGTSSVTLSFALDSDGESFPGCTSSDNKRNDSRSNLRRHTNKAIHRTRISKPAIKQDRYANSLKCTDTSKIGIDLENSSSTGHTTHPSGNHANERGKIDVRERVNVTRENTRAAKTDGHHQTPSGYDGRILKVGKDATMMSTLLTALRRDGIQKQKGTSGHSAAKRNDRENVTNSSETLVRNLKFSVLYKRADNSTPLLYVSVLDLEGVSEELITPLHSIYVKFCLFPMFKTWRRTKTVNISDKQLVFKDHFIISGVKPVDLEQATLRFIVVCNGQQERDIGQLEVPLAELKSRDKLKRTCALQPPGVKDDGIAG